MDMNRSFIIALREVIRDQLIRKNVVHIEGLGQFEVVHKQQHQKTFDSGRVVMMPPSDVLEFKSNIRLPHED
jgi:nucleoid DNA-binding protein